MNKISLQNWAWVDLNSADQCKYLIANLLRTNRIKDIESLSDYAARVLENLKDDAEASKNAHKGWRRQLNKTTHSNNNASDVNSALSQSSATVNTTNNEQPTPEAPLRRPYSAQIDYSQLPKYPPPPTRPSHAPQKPIYEPYPGASRSMPNAIFYKSMFDPPALYLPQIMVSNRYRD